MRLTLMSLSSQYIHLSLSPFCLRKAVAETMPETEIAMPDLNINDPQEEILRRVLATRPDVLALSVYIWNRTATARLIRSVKAARPETVVVVGGPEVTWSVPETFREMPCDFVLRGAGEESLPALLKAVSEKKGKETLEEIPGCCYREGEELFLSAPAEAPAPRDDLYDEAWHICRAGRMIYAETSRGCPFSCAFCLSGQREKVQMMDREQALRLLIRLGREDTDTVKLIDRTFNCDRERTKYLLSGLIDARRREMIGNVCYHLEVAADLFDEETLALLDQAPAGLFQMEAGLQSFHPDTLAACHRATDMDRLQANIRRILAGGRVHLHIDLIAGLPGESFETFGRSFDRAIALRPHQLQLGFLKLIYGSELRGTDWGQRFSPDPPYEILSTPDISFEELSRLHPCAEAVEKIWNSRRFGETMNYALEQTGMRPFDLFLTLGDRMDAIPGKWSLDRLTLLIWDTLRELGLPEASLSDRMRLDRLATDNTGYLPDFLRLEGPELKQASARWRKEHPEVRHPRFALMSDGQLLVACWDRKHPVTGRGVPEPGKTDRETTGTL